MIRKNLQTLVWPHLTTRNKSRQSSWDRVESHQVYVISCIPNLGIRRTITRLWGIEKPISETHVLYTPSIPNLNIRKNVSYKFKIRGQNFRGQHSLRPEPFPAMCPPRPHLTLCPGPLGIASTWAGKGKPETAGTGKISGELVKPLGCSQKMIKS